MKVIKIVLMRLRRTPNNGDNQRSTGLGSRVQNMSVEKEGPYFKDW